MYSTIIVPVDGTRPATAATLHGALLAQLLDAELRLLHVMPPEPAELSDIPANRTADTDADRAARRQAAEEAVAAAHEVTPSDAAPRVTEEILEDSTLTGDTAARIIDYVTNQPDSFLVIGSRRLDDLHKVVLDSVSHTVLHKVPGPVTLVHGDDADKPQQRLGDIILPVDGSAHADAAAGLAGALAEAAHATVQLLHVIGERDASVDPTTDPAFENTRAALAERAITVYEHCVTSDHPADAILEFASNAPADSVIVMGRRGLGPIREKLLGSVSHKVVDRATCPVTVIASSRK